MFEKNELNGIKTPDSGTGDFFKQYVSKILFREKKNWKIAVNRMILILEPLKKKKNYIRIYIFFFNSIEFTLTTLSYIHTFFQRSRVIRYVCSPVTIHKF